MSTHGSAEATAELVLGEIVVVGLGPGDAGLLTRETLIWLESDRPRWLRTRIHPTIAGLPGAAGWASFDDRYEAADSFAALYQEISDALIDAALAAHAADGGPIVYAVPGHPTIGESTVALLRVAAPQQHVRVRIIPALSFLDALAPHLPVDPLRDSVQIVDGLELAAALDREPFGGGTMPIAPMRPALIGQVYNAATASAVKLALDRFYPHDHPVTVLRAGGVPGAEEAITVPLHALDHREAGAHDHLTSLFVPALPPERAVRTPEGLQAIVARLRAPDGCPWDREQTHQSIRANFIEETYEALDALDAGDMDAFREELGDVLLQVYLQAQMAEEGGDFILEDVYEAIGAKLVRRHPHVFGATVVADSGEVLQNWEQIKEAERRAKGPGRPPAPSTACRAACPRSPAPPSSPTAPPASPRPPCAPPRPTPSPCSRPPSSASAPPAPRTPPPSPPPPDQPVRPPRRPPQASPPRPPGALPTRPPIAPAPPPQPHGICHQAQPTTMPRSATPSSPSPASPAPARSTPRRPSPPPSPPSPIASAPSKHASAPPTAPGLPSPPPRPRPSGAGARASVVRRRGPTPAPGTPSALS
jgi:tetrapyrrole methylase family protein/MazG family protein